MALSKTVLDATHQQAGAKMVDFGGWEMPLHYGSQLQEHLAVRQDSGIFDVSHMTLVELSGKEVVSFLRHVLANDIVKITKPGKALYSCMLNPEGGIIDDLIVYYIKEQHYQLVLNCATGASDLAWLNEQATRFAVTLKHLTDKAIIAIQGPQAIAKVLKVLSPAQCIAAQTLTPFSFCISEGWQIAYTGYTGEAGFEVILPATEAVNFWKALVATKVHPCGLGARDTLRLEAGLHLYGVDMNEAVSPLISGLSWTVDFKDEQRDFIGKKALMAEKAAGINCQWVGLVLECKGVLRNGLSVILKADQRGTITSGGFSPTLNRGIALARIPLSTATRCEVEVRGKLLPARVVKPSFVRYGKSLLEAVDNSIE